MKKEQGFIGIDPGKTGAIAIITPNGIDIMDWGETHEIVMQLKEWHEDYELRACIEKAQSMPGQGVVGMFNYGVNFGTWKGVLYALGIPYFLVTPQKWQSKFFKGMDEPTTKDKSLSVVRNLYPSLANKYFKRKMDHGRSDALLIAIYAKNYHIEV